MITKREIMRTVNEIVRLFQPQRIVLFGSYAYSNPTNNSDVDLLILMQGKRVHDRALSIRQSIKFGFPVDLVVRSPEEFERRISWGDFFLLDVQEKGKVLYESPDKGVGRKGRRGLQYRTARTAIEKIAEL